MQPILLKKRSYHYKGCISFVKNLQKYVKSASAVINSDITQKINFTNLKFSFYENVMMIYDEIKDLEFFHVEFEKRYIELMKHKAGFCTKN